MLLDDKELEQYNEEYREANQEYHKLYNQKYYQKNIENNPEKYKEKAECIFCHKLRNKYNMTRHHKTCKSKE